MFLKAETSFFNARLSLVNRRFINVIFDPSAKRSELCSMPGIITV